MRNFDHLHEFPLYSRIPVKAAAHFYKAILDKTRKRIPRLYEAVIYSTQEKALILEDIT